MGLNKEYFLSRNFNLLNASPTICLSEEDEFCYDYWVELINNSSTSLNDKDTIYIKHCAIPEHKINLYYPNVKIVDDLELADKIVVNDKLLSRVFDFDVNVPSWVDSEDNSYNWKKVSVNELLKSSEFSSKYKSNSNYYNDIIKNNKNGYVYIKGKHDTSVKVKCIWRNIPTVRVKTINNFGNYTNLVGTKKQLLYLEMLYEALSKNKKFIFESQITNRFNQGASVINEDIFELISKMLDSPSREEWQLARELISNVEVNSSRAYLLILLNKYNRKFVYMSSHRDNNYKALINALGLKPDEFRLNWINFYSLIFKKYKFSNEEIEVLKKHAINNLNAKFVNQVIKINDISIV